MFERDVTFRPTRAVTSARMSIERAFGRLTQRLASSATLQPFVRRVVWIWVTAAVLLVFGAVGASAAKSAPPVQQRADQRLNVVVILSDDERSDGTGVMKNVQTLLADHGVTFTNCARDDLDVRSVAGEHPHRPVRAPHRRHSTTSGRTATPPSGRGESNDLPVWLHAAGYETALVGKYLNAYTTGLVHHAIPPGWDDWQADGQHPDGGVLQLLAQRQRPPRPLRQQAVGLLDQRAGAQGGPVHQAERATRSSSTSRPVAPHLPAIPAPRRPGQAREHRAAPFDLPSTSATSARSRGASGTRTCSAPPPSSTSTTSASARRSRCSRSTAASAASCTRSRHATS